jgi:hypothetical protein
VFELRPWRVAGVVFVRIASRVCAAAMIQKTVSSRKFRLRGSVVGGVRCMSFASNSNTSRLFAKPKSGRSAVKVINHLGDEVMKVFRA